MTALSRSDVLRRRANLLRSIRKFFDELGFLEVETPLLSSEVVPELHIEPFPVPTAEKEENDLRKPCERLWLQASPELHMKRLVAEGFEAIYQIGKSFRRGERGPLHRPEFTLVEWYRTGDDMQDGMRLLDELMQALLNTPPAKWTTYADAFQAHVGINPHSANVEDIAERTRQLDVDAPAGLSNGDRDEWLNLLVASKIEPQLGREGPELLYEYPASQAALANVGRREDGVAVAERFELYWRGVELANGYHELTDADELQQRFEHVNRFRQADGRSPLPMPESLLAAMHNGMAPCAGCALGFDRLAMLACNAMSINEVVAFS